MKNNKTSKGVWTFLSAIVVTCIALALMTAANHARAATITVMNTNDSGAGSLRQAIIDAGSGDTIDFSVTGTITLTTGELPINKDLSIAGPGISNLIVSGNHASRVFEINSGKAVMISGLTISDGSGGGIFNGGTLTLDNVVVSGNSSANGGGVFNFSAFPGTATLTVNNCTISDNSALAPLFGGGGGIFNNANSNGTATLTVSNSTISGNSSLSFGGGIANSSQNHGTATTRIINSTLSGNSACCAGGGGISNFTLDGSTAMVTASNCTISSNSASDGGGVFNSALTTVNIKNSIVANSTSGGDCSNLGTWNGTGKNFSTDSTCPGFTQVTSAQLNLGPRANNGGPTQTHALLSGSVAIDAVTDCTDVFGNPITTDQRGATRPVDGDGNGSALCDVGSFESQCLTCPSNITQSNDLDQCGAVVNYPPPTPIGDCGTLGCSPESGSFFPKGTTTVTCSTIQDSPVSCSFTITVNDTQPPSITCPNQNAALQASCPIATGPVAVAYPPPIATDNCPGVVTVACTPPSGSPFPVGTTTVNCKATDVSGNMSTCGFAVNVFSFCLQDETNTGNFVFINAATGDYSFFCNGVLIASGTGTLNVKGCQGSIEHNKGDRRVLIKLDTTAEGKGAGTAIVQLGVNSPKCQITDKNMSNNTCAMSAPPVPPGGKAKGQIQD
jgi:HYR domain